MVVLPHHFNGAVQNAGAVLADSLGREISGRDRSPRQPFGHLRCFNPVDLLAFTDADDHRSTTV